MVTLKRKYQKNALFKITPCYSVSKEENKSRKEKKKKRSKQQDINAYKRVTELLVLPC